MTTLVLGASGAIGRLTVELLAGRGDTVVAADLRPGGPPCAGPGRVIEAIADVTDAAALERLVAGHGVRRIVHTAALLSTAIRQDPLAGVRVNVMGTANVLECARRHGVGRVVCASSTTVTYACFAGLGPEPIPEDAPMRVISDRPTSVYAATKLADEHLALLWHELYGVDAVVLRYGAVLGGEAGMPTSVPGRLMALLAQAGRSGAPLVLDDPILGWGGREEFVDARDCARANLHALDADEPRQRVYNVAPGDWHTLPEFVDAMRRIFPALRVTLPAPSPRGFAGFAHQRPAPSAVEAAARELGFRCAYRLEDSLGHWCGDTAA